MPLIAPYGSWRSPLSSGAAAAGEARFAEVRADGASLYWREGRRSEGGRATILRRAPDGTQTEFLPASFNARTLVHEYGGGAFAVRDGVCVFSNFADQRLYGMRLGETPGPITAPGRFRYADGVIDTTRQRYICVREDHRDGAEPRNVLASIDLRGDDHGATLFDAADFVAAPTLSPCGARLAWISWSHPHMSFDRTTLWLAELTAQGTLTNVRPIAEGASILEPRWSPEGELHFVADWDGWWSLYRWADSQPRRLYDSAGFEHSAPLWFLGPRSYDFLPNGDIVAARCAQGVWELVRVTESGAVSLTKTWTEITQITVCGDEIFFVGANATRPPALIRFNPGGEDEIIAQSAASTLAPEYVSAPEAISFPASDGATAHGFHYRPRNPEFTAPRGAKPPLIVMAHGGPHYATAPVYDPNVQFFTTRGFAVLDLNYAGSSGFGRLYRERLNAQWGFADADDCAAGARFLVDRGDADGAQLIIRGQSAGGFIVLSALARSTLFRIGSSHYGPADLERLLHESHKLESHYPWLLIGAYPQMAEAYRARSPLHNAERIKAALIVFQGSEDAVVPPNQSRAIVESVRRNGGAVRYIEFAGEQHGFRRAENVARVLDEELAFFAETLGISHTPAAVHA